MDEHTILLKDNLLLAHLDLTIEFPRNILPLRNGPKCKQDTDSLELYFEAQDSVLRWLHNTEISRKWQIFMVIIREINTQC